MPRLHYCLPQDVLRKFDPTLTVSEVAEGELGPDGLENIRVHIQEVEAILENTTGHAWRLTRVGREPALFEHHEANLYRYQNGLKLYLDHRDVLPFDATEGDAIQVRSGNSWTDITEQANWELDPSLGILYIDGARRWLRGRRRDRAVRVSYRYGGLGGNRLRGGQSALTDAAGQQDTTLTVDDPLRLPSDGLLLVGGKEYVNATSVASDGTVAVNRGVRNTAMASHDAGATVHYCPEDIRSAVAAKTAIELAMYDDHVERLMETRESMRPVDKIENWRKEWQSALEKRSEVKSV